MGFLVLLGIVLSPIPIFAQYPFAIESPSSSEARATTDGTNVYVTGSFDGTADFDPGAGTASLTSENSDVFVAAYDALGRQVVTMHDGPLEANHRLNFVWEPDALPSGLYFVRVRGEHFVETGRVVLNP